MYTILQGGAVDAQSRAKLERQITDGVSACMKRLGFELLDGYSTAAAATAGDSGFDPKDRKSVAVFGYGLTTIPMDAETGPGEYPAEWSAEMQNAYAAALYGDSTAPGCDATVRAEVNPGGAALEKDPTYAALMQEFQELWSRVDADARTAALNADWASCMADAGFPDLKTQADAGALAYEKVGGLGPKDTLTFRSTTYSPSEFEIDVALADFDCQEAVSYEEHYKAIRVEYENDIAERFADEIQSLVLEYGQ
ncbi:hypothetical protein [Cellulomonas sp.]|uniref:hypothetical protein n=1 Tax=Cellulomonas sp. TaxID=40001 RepID=UPI001B056B17|nr:hypothetical protein [Cellulomonas sp.]MBO9553218.1 hypothetical protein [Cellulomonas sp.]